MTGPVDSPEVLARVREGLDLVEIIARQMIRTLHRSVELNDLLSLGREGLLSAARSFEPSRGVPFRRWANLRVRGTMIDGIRSMGTLPRGLYKELRAMEAGDHVAEAMQEEDSAAPAADAERADARLGAYLSGIATAMAIGLLGAGIDEETGQPQDQTLSAEELLAKNELLHHARASIATLPEKERRLLERHYFDGVTFEDAARELGLSKSWGSRLHARAIEAVVRDLRRTNVLR